MFKSILSLFILSINLFYSADLFSQIEEKWVYKAKSQLYAPPLVADITPDSGYETVISDSEIRILRCISATGEQIWEFNGQWKKRLSSIAALTRNSSDGNALLLIGNGDGSLTCISAKNGKKIWQVQAGSMVWGNAIWADLDGDGIDEAIAGTDDKGIIAFNIHGKLLWTYKGGSKRPKLSLKTPISAADINGDGKMEIFAADRAGIFSLNGKGSLLWETQTGDEFNTAPVIADADLDGKPELYATSFDDNILYALNAVNGDIKWQYSLLNKVGIYSGSSIAVGDIDGDGSKEIFIADDSGHVYCINNKGDLVWIYTIKMKTHSAISLGDVDGDENVDILITSGDHTLYSLNNKGLLQWKYKADLRLIYSATITDIENDGKTEILISGSGGKLRSLTLNGKYNLKNIPWATHRFDASRSGSSFEKQDNNKIKIKKTQELLPFGNFEQTKIVEAKSKYPTGSKNFDTRVNRPRAWFAESTSDASWQLDSIETHGEKTSLKITTKKKNFLLGSNEIAVNNSLKSIDVEVWFKSNNTPKAEIIWKGVNGVIRVDPLPVADKDTSGWALLKIDKLIPPKSAMWFKLVLKTEAGKVIWWDAASIQGYFEEDRKTKVYVNQLGFEKNGPKYFTASSNFKSKLAEFEILDNNNILVYRSTLNFRDRIKGAFGNDWGSFYWRGNFSQINKPGQYRIKIILDGQEDVSWPFEIAENIYWSKTVKPAYRFFYYQRCGMKIPGFHEACHLDDATGESHKIQFNLSGGWHDAGDYNKYYNAPYVLGLASAYERQEKLFKAQQKKENQNISFLDEILWGADFSRRMVAPDGSARGQLTSGWGYFGAPDLETDNIPNTGDERTLKDGVSGKNSSVHTAAMAKVARITKNNGNYIETAQRGLQWALKQNKQGTLQLSAAIDLFLTTGDKEYADISKRLFEICGLDDVEITIAYDKAFKTDHKQIIKEKLTKEADKMLAWSDNPFGFYTYGPKENPNFFATPKDKPKFAIGTNHYVLDAVEKMARAYLYNQNPKYLEFIYNQLNWILGNNPYGISLMEGIGSSFAPTYHHRYFLTGVPRGAVPGGIINGIVWKDIGMDTPYFDMSGVDIPFYASNEFWLPHNTNYLKAMSVIQKIVQNSK